MDDDAFSIQNKNIPQTALVIFQSLLSKNAIERVENTKSLSWVLQLQAKVGQEGGLEHIWDSSQQIQIKPAYSNNHQLRSR